jgi:nucleoside-diphosphate-sugar epimerase
MEESGHMRILVTGALGKVGAATVHVLHEAGHDVTACDLRHPTFERAPEVAYVQADLADAGSAYAVVRGHDAVIHAAALPDPEHNPAHVVFQNNLMAVFNALEAAVRFGVDRFVNVSSETVPGFFFPERPDHADYAPVDEEHERRPQDPYATAKLFSELLMDGAIRRSDIRAISIRPSWVQWEGNYERNLGPNVRGEGEVSVSFDAYIDDYDLADAMRLAAESDLPGHEVFYIASPDNSRGRPLAELVAEEGGGAQLREVDREDASGISIAKARRLLGYDPKRSWRDYLDESGRLRPEMAEKLAAGATGVQRGRALAGF